jgi:hypothetical protein
MKVYAIRIAAYIPYPIYREYVEEASDFSVAISRAVKKYRKEERVFRKRIDRMSVQVVKGMTKFIG